MECNTCYNVTDKVPECIEDLIFITSAISSPVKVVITDKFDHKYSKSTGTNGYGKVTLDLTEVGSFPASLLNQYAGDFKITVYDASDAIIPFVIGGDNYDSIQFSVGYVSPIADSYLINL